MKKISLLTVVILIIQILLPVFTMVVESDLTIKSIAAEEIIGTWDISADDGESNVQATLYEGGTLVISGTGKMRDYTTDNMPPYIALSEIITNVRVLNGVTRIGNRAFGGCQNIVNAELADSIIEIGECAFISCSSLEKIEIPRGVKKIEDNTFAYCKSLSQIEIPYGVERIEYHAFLECKSKDLKKIVVPESVNFIEYGIFELTNLQDFELPTIFEPINDFVFASTTLKYFNIDVNEGEFYEIDAPSILRRAISKDDFLYSDNIEFEGCRLNGEGTKVIINGSELTHVNSLGYHYSRATIRIKSGVLNGLKIQYRTPSIPDEPIPPVSGEITFDIATITNQDVTATLQLLEGEAVTNNGGKNTYTFTKNGIFDFEYRTANNEIKTATAVVNWIDKTKPVIESVEQNPEIWTSGSVTLTVNATDNISIFLNDSYSFDGGKTWQKENTKVYTAEENNIVIKVRDDAGNVASYGPINLEKDGDIELTEIKITKEPNKKEYKIGENFDSTGMIVQAEYSNGTFNVVNKYSVPNGRGLKSGQTSVTISYTEGGITKTVDQEITVLEEQAPVELSEIKITNRPNKIAYKVGENFDPTGMVITAIYSDESSKMVTNYEVENGINLQAGQGSVTISYTEGDITKSAIQRIIVEQEDDEDEPAKLIGIVITKEPNKVEYKVGEDFDPTGMIVKAVYSDGTEKEVSNYSVIGGTNLQTWVTYVLITYREEKTKTAIQEIRVVDEQSPAELTKIKITKAPNKTEYEVGENFDPTGMVVKAEYSNGEETEITNYTVPNGINLQNGQKSVTIRYTEGGITKSTIQPITVKPAETPKLSVIINTFEEVTGGEMTYIENIKPGTTVKTLKDNIETNGTIEIYKESVKITNNNTKLTTGMTVKISLNDEQRNYVIVVTGDLNGDGNMDDIDLLKLARFKVGYLDASLIGEFYRAANIVRDNECANDIDLLKMARVLVDLEEL